jgi:hypothetical protein
LHQLHIQHPLSLPILPSNTCTAINNFSHHNLSAIILMTPYLHLQHLLPMSFSTFLPFQLKSSHAPSPSAIFLPCFHSLHSTNIKNSTHITNIMHFHPMLLSVSDSPSQSCNQFPSLPRSLPMSWDAGLYLLRYRFTNEVCMDNLLRFLLRD